jgi:L-seryl-tRNA(Ser) seleniumtransferase
MRIDKVSLTILENTLRIYLSENNFIIDKTPILKMITLSYETLYERVLFIKNELSKIIDNINIIDDYSQVGGGSLPTNNILTPVLEIKSNKISNNKLFNKLKNSDPSIIGILKNDSLIINLRTVFKDQDKLILDCLKNIMKNN